MPGLQPLSATRKKLAIQHHNVELVCAEAGSGWQRLAEDGWLLAVEDDSEMCPGALLQITVRGMCGARNAHA